jgi:NAD(P)-dependent dehydrogenase (short-subunit alcohol dehydrogenase family)
MSIYTPGSGDHQRTDISTRKSADLRRRSGVVETCTYEAAKAAMIHMTRTTAVRYAPQHIQVNAVLPALGELPWKVCDMCETETSPRLTRGH